MLESELPKPECSPPECNVIHMRNVPGDGAFRALDKPLSLINMDGTWGKVPVDYVWNGSSSEIEIKGKSKLKRTLLGMVLFPVNFVARGIFPRHHHPVASCRHDYRCENATNDEERLFADIEFEIDVGKTSWWITKKIGYLAVRTGARFGVGRYKQKGEI